MQKFLKFCLLGTVIGFSWYVFAASTGGGSAFENLAVKPFEGVVKGTGAAVSGVTKGTVNIVNGTVRTVAGGAKQVWNGTTWVAENAWSGIKSGSAWVADGVDNLLSKTTDNAGNIINGTSGAVASGTKGWNLTLDPSIAKEGFANAGSAAVDGAGGMTWNGQVANFGDGNNFVLGPGAKVDFDYAQTGTMTSWNPDGLSVVKIDGTDVYVHGTIGDNGSFTPVGTFDSQGNSVTLNTAFDVQTTSVTLGDGTVFSVHPGSYTAIDFPDGSYAVVEGGMTKISGTVTDIDGSMATVEVGGKEIYVDTKDLGGDVQLGDKVTTNVEGDLTKSTFSDATKEASQVGQSQAENLLQSQAQSSESALDEAKKKVLEGANPLQLANETNAAQYAIVILQAVEGTNQEDATREVTVQVEKFIESQGASSGSSIGPSVSLNGTTLSGAALAMANLLSRNPVDVEALLKIDDIEDCSGVPANISATKTEGILDDCVRDEIRNRRRLLLQMYGAAAQLIAGGSNSISADFYTRVRGVANAAKSTLGTLGAMSVVNDSERYPYFELVRQMALSSVQLGLKGANNLTLVDITDEGSAE